jgi:hypothetical protein
LQVDYHHNISHRLFFEFDSEYLTYSIINKENQLVKSGKIGYVDCTLVENLLTTNSILNKIFGEVFLIIRNGPFIPVPSNISENSVIEELYHLSHKKNNEVQILMDQNLQNCHFAFGVESGLVKTFENRFPNLKVFLDAQLLVAASKHIRSEADTNIYASTESKHVLLYVVINGAMVLINRYDVNNSNDIFYFVMLAVEQLDLNIERTCLHIFHGNSEENRISKDSFEPYLALIKDHPAPTFNGVEISWPLDSAIALS